MKDNIQAMREWFEIDKVQFGFLTPKQIRRISVCEINKTQVYDQTREAIRGGLYDPLLGVSPNDRKAECPTCGHKGLQCAGHPGHIELIVPVYNPLIVDVLLKMLRMTCQHCHRFRIRPKIKQDYVVLLELIRKDKISLAYEFFEINTEQEKRKIQKLENQPQDQREKTQYRQKMDNCMNRIAYAELIKQQYRGKQDYQSSSTSIQLFSQFVKFLYGLTQKKCPYRECKKTSHQIKKQGANKIFIVDKEVDEDEKRDRKKSRDSTSKGESTNHPGTQAASHTSVTHTEKDKQPKRTRQRYLTPKDIYNEMRKLWKNEQELVKIIFGNQSHSNSFAMFFINTVFVPPSRFRPQSKLGQEKYLHDHTTILARILQTNQAVKQMLAQQFVEKDKELDDQKFNGFKAVLNSGTEDVKNTRFYGEALKRLKGKGDFINKWLELQDGLNCFIDAKKSSKASDKDFKGVRQILQKKEGLFRMKMMGKRVNYAARSVISPDPSLNTDEVGIPLFMSKKLTFCQYVNEYNLQKLQSYIINGKKYPGANFLEENGKLIKLDLLSEQQRISHARNLMNNHENKVVYRHLHTGDNVLFNRQPTLHKAGLMAHRVKVLPKESTLRMNYANCKSYNADFDGDEMNLHALQTYTAKAEAQLCISDQMYQSPTDGKPLRQIMQDAIIAAVYLSMRDMFLEKSQYSELLYQATFSLFADKPKNARLFLLKPAILKPRPLWTGKQLISNVIKVIVQFSDLPFRHQKGISMRSQSKIPQSYMMGYEQQSQVVFVDNQFVKGFIDKNQVGSKSDYGFIHSFVELYGEATAGKLMTCLNKLFLNYMQISGFTCGLDDLMLKTKVDKTRKEMINTIHTETVQQVCKGYGQSIPKDIYYMGRSNYKCNSEGQLIEDERRCHVRQGEDIVRYLQYKIVNQPQAIEELDGEYKHHLNQKASKVIDQSLAGMLKQFPKNNFSMMTITGAKGSNVNHSQVAVMLGQQELEGKRVPIMITGKTLPSFKAYDPNPRASGFIADRFLTGLREQQFYFHCMAGRQGLIDTAVKTSRSGYLQRCLMKHLQSLKVQYDLTVRDSDGSIVQFLYGQDGLNSCKDKFFLKLDFLKNNMQTFKRKFKYDEFKDLIKNKEIRQFKTSQFLGEEQKTTTIHDKFSPTNTLGSISERAYQRVLAMKQPDIFGEIFALKYKRGMVEPGEAVGCTAAQSIGQPSTQMTLNTFHLAGHGGVNLTLGIPRLRQLLMTSSDKIKTPVMQLNFSSPVTKEQAQKYSKLLQRVRLGSLIKAVSVQQWKQLMVGNKPLDFHERKRFYRIVLTYQNEEFMKMQYGIDYENIKDKIKRILVVQLLSHINRVKKRSQLRAEIKRTHHVDKEVDEDEDDDQIQSNPERDEEKDKEQKEKMVDEAEEKERNENYNSQQFQKIIFNDSSCEITVKVALSLKKFLMTKVIQKLLTTTIIKEISGINKVIVLERKEVPYLQTQGVNFDSIHKFNFIAPYTTRSNDVQAVAKKLGIEAARNTMIFQIVNLFKAYNVSVDYRHMYLIGDYMTFGGMIKAMNRNWMNYNPSPFLRMTFETSVKYISEAALRCEVDHCRTPSSRIILGQAPQLGTGLHQLLMETQL